MVAKALLLDDETIRRWDGAFAEGSRSALMRFQAGVIRFVSARKIPVTI
jgi:hypothetical protein